MDCPPTKESGRTRSINVKELALLFAKLGATAFGGPAAHIAMMEEEVVKRRQWLSHERFLDLLGATNLIPGPNSTEMALHIGYLRGGWRGLIVAGACFIVPAVLLTLLFAHLYVLFGTVPALQPFVAGIRPAIVAVIAAAVVRLGRPMVKKRFPATMGVIVVILSLIGVNEILLLFCAGFLGLLWAFRDRISRVLTGLAAVVPFLADGILRVNPSVQLPATASVVGLGLFFLKIGSILYGSGYVLVAFLQGGLVDTNHWLTQTQLFDAIAVGQFTPGPVLSTATFIGYVILGVPGAAVATTAIFLPSFLFVLLTNPFLPRLRNSRRLSGFLDGVNAASLGLMISVTITLGLASLTGVGPIAIFVIAAVVVIGWKVNAGWVVLGSAILGAVLHALHI